MLKYLIIYNSILNMGKFINWDILLPIILDPCLLIPLFQKHRFKLVKLSNFETPSPIFAAPCAPIELPLINF